MPPFNAHLIKKADRLTVENIAELLGVSTTTIRRRKAEGVLPPAKRSGHQLYYTRNDILAWLPGSNFGQAKTELAMSRLKAEA